MENTCILAFCNYSSTTTVVRLSHGDKFDYFIGMLKSRWPELINLDMRISYSVSGYETILLDNDMDIEIMLLHCFQSGINRIDVDIVERNNVSGKSISIQPNVDGHTSNVSQSQCSNSSNVGSSSTPEVLFSDRWSIVLTEVGQIFGGGPEEFRIALSKYAIEKGFNYLFIKNDADRVTAKCSVEYCQWKIHARYDGYAGHFFIKQWNNKHDCNGGIRTVKHQRANSKLVANLFEKQIRSKPSLKPIEVKEQLRNLYGLDVHYSKAWRGKEMALVDVQGDERLAFDRLRAYEEAVLRSNPGSRTSLEYDHSSGKFHRFFIAFGGCIEGFKHCRPMLFLDGTFLKGKYKGILLSASGKNGDQGMYPLCFGLVDAENERNWIWFVQKLYDILDPQRTIVFISDRNKGLLEAISARFPGSPHGFCLEHLKQNLRTKINVYRGNKFREKLVSLFTRVVHARTHSEFIHHMTMFRSVGGKHVENFIDDLPAVHWSNAYFPGCRYGEMTSNIAECFNNWIKEERSLPVDVMFDQIRLRLMEQMAGRLREAKFWRTTLCPKIETRLIDAMRSACNLKVTRSTEFIFEVHSTPVCVVDLSSHSCGCREWDVEGFPCGHALAAIQFNEEDVYKYCQHYFTTSAFIDSYSSPIYPVTIDSAILGSENEVIIKAPTMKRPAGRPKRKRGESKVDQFKKNIHCTRCGKVGNHNRRSCKEPI